MAEGDESDNENQNQSRLNNSLKYFQDHLEDQDRERMIKDFIRLALYRESNRLEVTREDFMKLVLKVHPKAFQAVFYMASLRMKNMFGMELVQTTSREKKKSSTELNSAAGSGVPKLKNSFIVRYLASECDPDLVRWKEEEEKWMPLLLTILSVILGNGKSIPYEALKELLAKMNIDLEAKSPEFGDMKELYAMWIKQGYLDKFKNDQINDYTVVWGPRSKIIFPETLVIQFMLEMYGEVAPAKKTQLSDALLNICSN